MNHVGLLRGWCCVHIHEADAAIDANVFAVYVTDTTIDDCVWGNI